ncbi:hypothetical protein [Halobaculum sp. D14]|uniref:hypothetical protein n=1 Tax=unclassified Halobaculum TaxID=2640896 RepID=UPI003EBF3A5C
MTASALAAPTVASLAAPLAAALLQLPEPLNTTLGKVFLALVAFLAVLLVGRIVMKVAWKLALVAALVVGAFLLVTTYLL